MYVQHTIQEEYLTELKKILFEQTLDKHKRSLQCLEIGKLFLYYIKLARYNIRKKLKSKIFINIFSI